MSTGMCMTNQSAPKMFWTSFLLSSSEILTWPDMFANVWSGINVLYSWQNTQSWGALVVVWSSLFGFLSGITRTHVHVRIYDYLLYGTRPWNSARYLLEGAATPGAILCLLVRYRTAPHGSVLLRVAPCLTVLYPVLLYWAVIFIPIPLPRQVLQTSYCTHLLSKDSIQTVFGVGMGMNGTAHLALLDSVIW